MNQQPIFGNVHVLACQERSMLQVGAIPLVKLALSFSGIKCGKKGSSQSSCGQVVDGNKININSSQFKKK